MPHPHDEAAIREQAYYLWEADGRPDGHESEYWLRAVTATAEKPASGKVAKPKLSAPKANAAVKPVAKAAAKPAKKATPKLKAAASKTKAPAAKVEAPAKKPKKK